MSGTPTISATSGARNPLGAGPRTTTPTFGLVVRTARATSADAAHARTSAVVTTTTRSARSSAVTPLAPRRRGRSTTTATPASRALSITPAIVSTLPPPPVLSPDKTTSPRRCGSARRRASKLTLPPRISTSGQRRPGMSSQPSSRSIPPPYGSASTIIAPLGARRPIAAHKTEAPAPPRPPTTTITGARPAEAVEGIADKAATSLASSSGKASTCSAPTSTARRHTSLVGSSLQISRTRLRRGNCASAAIDVSAPSRTTAPARVHACLLMEPASVARTNGLPAAATIRSISLLSCRSPTATTIGCPVFASTTPPSALRGRRARGHIEIGDADNSVDRSQVTAKIGDERPQKRGRPSPGGEEARVVVHQPRGVGLRHTRHSRVTPLYTRTG